MSVLSGKEQAHAEDMKREWLETFGDDEFIRQAYKAGVINGWRDVVEVRPLTEEEKAADKVARNTSGVWTAERVFNGG